MSRVRVKTRVSFQLWLISKSRVNACDELTVSFVYLYCFWFLWSLILELVFLRWIPEDSFICRRDGEVLNDSSIRRRKERAGQSASIRTDDEGGQQGMTLHCRSNSRDPSWQPIDSANVRDQRDLESHKF